MLGEPRTEDRHRENYSTRQAGDLRVPLHHPLIGQLVRSADFPYVGLACGFLNGSHKDLEDIRDGYRLAAGAHPSRGDHDRQDLGEVSQHLE